MKPYIYKLTDTRNGKIYIGQTNGKYKGYFTGGNIPRAIIKKHGKEVFKRELIVQGDFNQELLNQLEIHYIQLFNSCIGNGSNGYNISLGGLGKDPWNKGKSGLQEAWNKGKEWNEEEKENRFCDKENDPQRKEILQFDLKGNFIAEWKSSNQYCRKNGKDSHFRSNIRCCCNGNSIKADNFIFLDKDSFDQKELNRRVNLIASRPSQRPYLKFDLQGNFISKYQEENIYGPIKANLNGVTMQSDGFLYIWEEEYSDDILKEKLSIINTKKEIISTRKPVVQIDKDTHKIIKVWSMSEAPRNELGILNVQYACNGKRKSAGGFIWRYKRDLTDKELEEGQYCGTK